MKLLKRILDGLEHKSEIVTHIEFPENINFSDDFLHYIAQRLPKLIHLQLPCNIGTITTVGFSKAIRNWGEMKSLRMGSINLLDYSHIIHEIGSNCKNLEMLNIYTTDMEVGLRNGQTFVLDEYTSLQITKNLRSMKNLVFRHCILSKTGLKNIMSKCKCLETILIVRCRRASTIPNFECQQTEYVSKLMTKDFIEDNTTDWSLWLWNDKRINSTPSIFKYLWQFEEEACD
ncbi:hypothetical protein AQUCO_01400809v1 [Aquilegia coerulea]|nr:hypothetical protein AQUCO_01400809v1 [Aquilegia coerulea]